MPSFSRVLRPTALLASFLAVPAAAHPGSGIAVDKAGRIHFLDTGSGLWTYEPSAPAPAANTTQRPAASSPITRRSSKLFHWLAIDEQDRFASTRFPAGADGEIIKVGKSPTILISSDYPIAIGASPDGDFYYPAREGRGSSRMRLMRMTPDGATSVFATFPASAPATANARANYVPHISGLAIGPDGSIYCTDNNLVRRVSVKGELSTIASVPRADSPPIPGTEENPYLRGLAADAQGIVYVADASAGRVLKITPPPPAAPPGAAATSTTILQLESPWSPTAVALHDGVLYVQEYLHTEGDDRRRWLPRIRKVSPPAPGSASEVIVTVDQMPGARQ